MENILKNNKQLSGLGGKSKTQITKVTGEVNGDPGEKEVTNDVILDNSLELTYICLMQFVKKDPSGFILDQNSENKNKIPKVSEREKETDHT